MGLFKFDIERTVVTIITPVPNLYTEKGKGTLAISTGMKCVMRKINVRESQSTATYVLRYTVSLLCVMCDAVCYIVECRYGLLYNLKIIIKKRIRYLNNGCHLPPSTTPVSPET